MEQKNILQKDTKRMSNIELLRILAMMMVIMLHYLGKGNLLPQMQGPITANGYAAWAMETLSIVAVNVYMLISGYFLSGSGFKTGRLLGLLCQILCYSIMVPVVLAAFGVLTPGDLNLYVLLQYVFPVQMEQYWFATAYVVMYLFSPILGIAVRSMKKRQLQAVICILLLLFSLNKSILPVRLVIDNKGYDGLWFVCVYLVAAYMRLYGMPFFKNTARSFLLYLAGCCGILGITLVSRALYLSTGKFETFLSAAYEYNHILNLFAAAALFYTFFHLKLKEGWVSRVIVKIAPYTFGVYLLHEHVELRYRWHEWLGVNAQGSVPLFVLRSIGTVALVFAVGVGVDMLRGLIFGLAGKLLAGRSDGLLRRLDSRINGLEDEQ